MYEEGASEVRILSREEIQELVDSGKITPIDQIPYFEPKKLISNDSAIDGKYNKYYRGK